MKFTGITKNVDASYRIAIPAEIREQLDIKKGDSIDFYVGKRGQLILIKSKEK